jgi:hypothetical protein
VPVKAFTGHPLQKFWKPAWEAGFSRISFETSLTTPLLLALNRRNTGANLQEIA